MPPRSRKTTAASAARSRSNSRSNSRRNSTSKPAELPTQQAAPAPDPAAVQRLIDEAMARAAARRSATPAGRTAQSAQQHSPAARSGFIITRFFNRLFPGRDVIYSPHTTAMLTDLIGTFLITCLAIYFTTAGYLFYREMALAE